MRVGVDRTKYSIQIPLPPKIDPTVSLMTVEDKPDVTYDEVGAWGRWGLGLWGWVVAGDRPRYKTDTPSDITPNTPHEPLTKTHHRTYQQTHHTHTQLLSSPLKCRWAAPRRRWRSCGRWWSCPCCTRSALSTWGSTRPRACCSTGAFTCVSVSVCVCVSFLGVDVPTACALSFHPPPVP